MILFSAGWLALGLALLWDRFLVKLGLGERLRVGYVVPISEELLKYITFNLWNLPSLLLYGLFGLGEGLLEAFGLKKRLDLMIIFTGFATHFIFGLFFLVPVPSWISLLLATLSHIIWNIRILNTAPGARGRV